MCIFNAENRKYIFFAVGMERFKKSIIAYAATLEDINRWVLMNFFSIVMESHKLIMTRIKVTLWLIPQETSLSVGYTWKHIWLSGKTLKLISCWKAKWVCVLKYLFIHLTYPSPIFYPFYLSMWFPFFTVTQAIKRMEGFMFLTHLVYTAITLDRHYYPHVTDKLRCKEYK